jgi:uncharacterized protein with ParB-like and HNH nuclease domain
MDNFSLMLTIDEFLKDEEYTFKTLDGPRKIEITLPKDRTYSIPAYQREIRWKAENVNILIDDILIEKKFLGTILLNQVDSSNFEIIDGQQRISVFILILMALEKKLNVDYSLCKFQNKTYEYLFDVLKLDFNKTKIENDANRDIYFESDILEQRERFEIIWAAINNKIENMNPEQLGKFADKLLFSEINIILASNNNSKIYVDYYLDLNDKSVKLDNIDILKANLFKIDFKTMSEEWANVQKSIKELRTSGLKSYSIPTFYYHYFACTVNEYLDYKLSILKTDLKFDKAIEICGQTYEAGSNILNAVSNKLYFKNAIIQLKNVTSFLSNIFNNDGLLTLKSKLKNNGCKDITISCIFSILNALIKIDDEVPKMLIMKYFFEILNQPTIKKEDINLVFYIYAYSISFTLTSGKKESSRLIRVVLSKDWKAKLKTATVKLWDEHKGDINYLKKITENGKVTDKSGQYLPKHIMAIKEFATINLNSTSVSFNQKKLKEFLTSSDCTAEHFFINQSHTVTFKYGLKLSETTINIPKGLIKYISCPVNYLYIKSKDNEELGNLSIKDKIELLKKKGKSAFSSEMSYKYFEIITRLFEDDGSYPDLSNLNKSTAQAAVRNYYKNVLPKIIDKYVEQLKQL